MYLFVDPSSEISIVLQNSYPSNAFYGYALGFPGAGGTHCVAITYDGTFATNGVNSIHIALDTTYYSVPTNTVTNTLTGPINSTTPLQIAYDGGGVFPFPGVVGYVKWWPTALSETFINSNVCNGSTPH